jgi:hypothetical protein
MFVDYLKVEIQVWLFALLSSLSVIMRREASEPIPASAPRTRSNVPVAAANREAKSHVAVAVGLSADYRSPKQRHTSQRAVADRAPQPNIE